MRGQTRDSVPWCVSGEESLAGRDLPAAKAVPQRHAIVLLAARHRCPGLCRKIVVEKRFHLHVWMSPWCKLVTFIAMMSDKEQ